MVCVIIIILEPKKKKRKKEKNFRVAHQKRIPIKCEIYGKLLEESIPDNCWVQLYSGAFQWISDVTQLSHKGTQLSKDHSDCDTISGNPPKSASLTSQQIEKTLFAFRGLRLTVLIVRHTNNKAETNFQMVLTR